MADVLLQDADTSIKITADEIIQLLQEKDFY